MVLRGEELAKWTGGFWQGGVPSTVEGLFFDTRIIEPNSLFIALSYGVRDGHDFVEKALERGASACMVEKALAYDIPQLIVPDSLEALANIARNVRGNFKNPVIGITGSCGKTSTKAMLEKVLGSDRTHTTSGNWNNCLGVSMTLAELHETDYGFSVIEAGVSGRGEMSVLSSIIRPNVCVFTNIGEAHLEGFGTVDSIAEEKSKLLESAEKGALVVAPKTVLERSVFEKYREDAVAIVKGSVETISPFKKVYGYEWTRLENHSAKVSLCCGDKNTLNVTAIQIIKPPIVGVSDFPLVKSASTPTSSCVRSICFILNCFSFAIIQGPTKKPIIIEVSPQNAMRKER